MSMKRKHNDMFYSKKQSSELVPWVEEFTPKSLEELAVHKKKISDVQSWFQKCFSSTGKSKEHHILLLTGPPGAGKTATVRAICNHLEAEVFVWSNSQHEKNMWKKNDDFSFQRDSFTDYENQTTIFSRFLLHSVKYSLFSDIKRVILVEEIPNALIRSPTDFHGILRKYSCSGIYPVIFILSDNTRGESLENRLFPKDLQSSLKIVNISFNPVAPTMLLKVLMKINNHSKAKSSCSRLSKSELDSIASDCMGDIRNAINTLQFMCMTMFRKPETNSKLPISKGHSEESEKSDKCNLKKNVSLFLFHALGKILYCKRDPTLKKDFHTLPANLKHLERDPLVSNPEDVFDRTSISPDAFALFLQENYLEFIEDINISSACANWLSEADVLSSYWNSKDLMSSYSSSLVARGLMFNLVPSTSGKRWRSLHKPQFYENNSKRNRFVHSLKYVFKGINISMRELQIDLLPYIRKLPRNSFNPAQVNLSNELGEMNVKRIFRPVVNTLDEKDFFGTESNDCDIELLSGSDNKDEDNLVEAISDDEEIIIEEYDY